MSEVKSKEEILRSKIDREKGYGMSVYDVSDFDVTDNVLAAMEEYARQQAEAFMLEYNGGNDDRFDVRYKMLLLEQYKKRSHDQ